MARRRDDDEEDRPRSRRREEEEDEEDEPRPRMKRRPADEDDEDERPRRKARAADEEDEEKRPRRRSRARDEDDEEQRPHRKKPSGGMSKGMLFGLLGGGVALVAVVVLLVVFLGGGGSTNDTPRLALQRLKAAEKTKDHGGVYDELDTHSLTVVNQNLITKAALAPPDVVKGKTGRDLFIAYQRWEATQSRIEPPQDVVVISETVTGDKATLMVSEDSKKAQPVVFVRQRGQWKYSVVETTNAALAERFKRLQD